MSNLLSDIATGLAGFATGGWLGAGAGLLGAASQKSGGNSQLTGANAYYQGMADRGNQAGQNITALLPGIFAQAGYKFGPGANGQPGTFQQQPFGNVYTDPALGYDAFHAKSIQPLENQRIAQTAQLGAMKGMGQSQRGFGQNLINTNFAQGEAQANRDWGLQQRQRQDQYFGMGLNALTGQAGAGQAAANGLTELGQYGQNRSDILNASQYTAESKILGQMIYQMNLAKMHRAAGTTGDGSAHPLLDTIMSPNFNVNDPAQMGPLYKQLGLPDPGSGGYGTVVNPYGGPGVYGAGG